MKHRTLKAADLFCGAGGTSTGLARAAERLGYQVRLTAINHWDIAVATHSANHPDARHLCASLDSVNPRDLYGEGELDLLWGSPECIWESRARGGRPINDQRRATAWCLVRWAEALRPPIILIENVEEFRNWGPIGADGLPLKSKRGQVFRAFIETLKSLGYKVDHRVLCAADYGDPTTRERLFIYAVRGRRKIIWPEPTHAKPNNGHDADLFRGELKPWVPAREIIDWENKGELISRRKRPLKPKTMRRILIGFQRFGLRPFIVPQQGGGAPRSTDQPVPTITSTARGIGLTQAFLVNMKGQSTGASLNSPAPAITAHAAHLALADPFLAKLRGTNNAASSIEKPVPTVTGSGGNLALVEPCLVQVAHGNGKSKNGDRRRSKSIHEPMPTVCGERGEWALSEPFIQAIDHHGGHGHQNRSIHEPLTAVTTKARHCLVESIIVKYYGSGIAKPVSETLDSVTTRDRFALALPLVIEIGGKDYLLDFRFRMLQPGELSLAQGFPADYQFTGNKSEIVCQIGNAVPGYLSEALCGSALAQL